MKSGATNNHERSQAITSYPDENLALLQFFSRRFEKDANAVKSSFLSYEKAAETLNIRLN